MGDDDIDVDALLAEVEAPTGAAAETPPEPAAAPDWRQSFEWKFKSGDKEIVVDDADKARTWLSQGHNYAQKMGALNQERAAWQRQREEQDARVKAYEPFKELDDYAKQNPDWWKHVSESYQQRGVAQVPPELQAHLSPVLQRLEQTEGVLQQWKSAEEQKQIEAEDAKLDQEVQSIREKHPNIDLSAVDPESGRSLEWRIYKHAADNGIKSFTTAFRDYLHDRLIDDAKASTLSQQAKDAQDKAKKGIIGTTRTPTKGLQVASTKGKSYDDLMREGMAELGLQA